MGDVGRDLLVFVVFCPCFGGDDDVEGMQGVDGTSARMLRGRRRVRATSEQRARVGCSFGVLCSVHSSLGAPGLDKCGYSLRYRYRAFLDLNSAILMLDAYLHTHVSSCLQPHLSHAHMARI